MATSITVKNIPSDLYSRLKQSAARNRRSINKEVISIIEIALRSEQLNPDEFLPFVRRLRAKTKRVMLTDEFILQAKHEGRP